MFQKSTTLILAVSLIVTCFAVGAVVADSIAILNPSFEANQNAAPGYGPVNDWMSTAGGVGVNGVGDAFIGPNEIPPDQNQIALIQGTGNLFQTISGLDTTKQYWLQLGYDGRDCCGDGVAGIRVSYAGTELFSNPNVPSVGDNTPYHFLHVPFVPTAAAGDLMIENIGSGADFTLFVDAVTVIQRDPDELVVRNPSFEASGDVSGSAGVGYISADQREMAGWTFVQLEDGNIGTNNSGQPFAINDKIPDGNHVALLQQRGQIEQRIDGFTPGDDYVLSYSYNARNETGNPLFEAEIGGIVAQSESVVPVADGDDYHRMTFTFTANAPSMLLEFRQLLSFVTDGTDQTLLLDDVSVRPVPEPTACCLALFIGLFALMVRRRTGRR